LRCNSILFFSIHLSLFFFILPAKGIIIAVRTFDFSTIDIHDPSAIIKEGDTYWVFSTGRGIAINSTTDLKNWNESTKSVFDNEPEWVGEYTGEPNIMWAPSVIYMNNAYHVYYSASSFGSSKSAIGLVKTSSLNKPDWIDIGAVIISNGERNVINAIDPAIFRDSANVWMVYGSWFGGIGLIEIDTLTGNTIGETTTIYGGNNLDVEAPFLFKHHNYYYLVVNRGKCCLGKESTYYLSVGRSKSVKGPYTGKLLSSPEYFSVLLGSEGNFIGPGHFGLFRDDTSTLVSIHYYQGNNATGWPAQLDILTITFEEGWPVLHRDVVINKVDVYKTSDDWFRVYLLPNSNGFTVEFNEKAINSECLIKIYNISGTLLFSEYCLAKSKNTFEQHSIGINGIYIISITGRDFSEIRKVMW
jgi:beta-xylosidase